MWIVIFKNGFYREFSNVIEAYEFFKSKLGQRLFYKKVEKNSR